MKFSDRSAVALKFKKVLWVTLLWMTVGSFQYWYSWSVVYTRGDAESDTTVGFTFLVSLMVELIAGLIGGSFVVFLFERWIRKWPYWKAGMYILAVFTLVFIGVQFVGFLLLSDQLLLQMTSQKSRVMAFIGFIPSIDFLRDYIFWFFIVILTIWGLMVYDKYGPGTMRKILLGKYFRPKSEERVFMFLDLRSSTQIAERLGERRYFNLLHDVVQDATNPILESKGEIYQYVGDEIVISWDTPRAERDSNCVRCFFAIQDVINARAEYYNSNYGVVPQYKAGLHYGIVVAGEIGVVKRDITFSGDVLNTTARIQSKCNDLGVDILISNSLLDRIKPLTKDLQPKEIGLIPLRGKSEEAMLYTFV